MNSNLVFQQLRTACFVRLPVGIADPLARLQAVEEHMVTLKRSTLPLAAFALAPLAGGLFVCMTKLLARFFSLTAIASNFP
jgi:hypothetical protein